MKKLLLLAICLFMFLNLRAQKVELSIQTNATSSHFRGSSTTDEAIIYQGYSGPDSNYTNNPYGKKYATGFNIAGHAQLITKGGFIAGMDAGYEMLRSHVNINAVVPALYYASIFPFTNYYNFSATGGVALKSSFINLAPFIGYRLKIKSLYFDFLPGAEFAITQSVKETGKATATYNNQEYPTTYPRKKIPVDTRLKFGLNTGYQKFSINFAYARGLSNYNRDAIYTQGNPVDIKSEVFRFGVGYRLL